MEFDKTRYVAPGVPRIEQRFVVERLRNLLTARNKTELDMGTPLETDNPELSRIQGLRNDKIIARYDSQKPSGEELEAMSKREFVLGGAMIHGTLALPEQNGRIEYTPSGILLVNPQRVKEFKAYLRGLSLIGRADLLTREIREIDQYFVGAIELFANMAVPHYARTREGKELLTLSSAMGSQVGYDLLVGQEAEYRFRDATREA